MSGAQVAIGIGIFLGIFAVISAGMAGAEGVALALARATGKGRTSARVYFFTHLFLVDGLAVAVCFALVPEKARAPWSLWMLPLIVIGRAVWADAASKADENRASIGRCLNAYALALGYLLVLFMFGFEELFRAYLPR